MTVPKSFPLHFPNLTRVNALDGSATAVEDFKNYLTQYLPIVILGDVEDAQDLMTNADLLCTQAGALPTQRILWVKDEATIEALKAEVQSAIESGFPTKQYSYENIHALSIEPASGKAAYLIYKDPSKSPDPKDSKKGLNTFQLQRAFNAAISLIPDTRDL